MKENKNTKTFESRKYFLIKYNINHKHELKFQQKKTNYYLKMNLKLTVCQAIIKLKLILINEYHTQYFKLIKNVPVILEMYDDYENETFALIIFII